MRLIFSDPAKMDLSEIGDYIAQNNPVRAARFIEEIEQCCKSLLTHPFRFPVHPSLSEGTRRMPHKNYLIFYVANDERVGILRILHASRDIENLMQSWT